METLNNYPGLRNSSLLMEELASKKNFSHITTAGDNFYDDGIEDITKLFKPWLVTRMFNKAYTGQLKIYPTLGNHDCHIDYTNEIKYSKINEHWEMENDYYELSTPLRDNSQKNFVNLMVNTCKVLCSNSKWTLRYQ